MAEYRWIDVKAQHQGAYRAERVDVHECRAEVVWIQSPGPKKPHRVTASLKHSGGSLWWVQKDFIHFSRAFNFFETAKEQAEIRLNKLNCAD